MPQLTPKQVQELLQTSSIFNIDRTNLSYTITSNTVVFTTSDGLHGNWDQHILNEIPRRFRRHANAITENELFGTFNTQELLESQYKEQLRKQKIYDKKIKRKARRKARIEENRLKSQNG